VGGLFGLWCNQQGLILGSFNLLITMLKQKHAMGMLPMPSVMIGQSFWLPGGRET